MNYLTPKEIAGKWGTSVQIVRRMCRQERVVGAIQEDGNWLIPANAKQPTHISASNTDAEKLHPLARRLINQKKNRNPHPLYDYVVARLTYSSCRMASNRLTYEQVQSIFYKGKVAVSFEPMKVSDLIEVMNHCLCVDYILDSVKQPLTQQHIKKLHHILSYGSVDDREQKVTPGQYRTKQTSRKEKFMAPADEISALMKALISEYETKTAVELKDILDFHVRFETIFPFDDCNGRIGRLIMFKECLRHGIMPFIIDDKRRTRYLAGIRKWKTEPDVLTDVITQAQHRFEVQIDQLRWAKRLKSL